MSRSKGQATRQKLKQDIARLVMHPRFCELRAYSCDTWKCYLLRHDKDVPDVYCISGNPPRDCVEKSLQSLRRRS